MDEKTTLSASLALVNEKKNGRFTQFKLLMDCKFRLESAVYKYVSIKLLKFKGNRNAKWDPNRSSSLLSRCHSR